MNPKVNWLQLNATPEHVGVILYLDDGHEVVVSVGDELPERLASADAMGRVERAARTQLELTQFEPGTLARDVAEMRWTLRRIRGTMGLPPETTTLEVGAAVEEAMSSVERHGTGTENLKRFAVAFGGRWVNPPIK